MRLNVVRDILIRDIKRLLHNWVAVVVVLAVCILPALYAWFNIGANMDPYQYTSNIKVGVANCDKGTTNELTGDLNVGGIIIDKLKENDGLGWEFVSEEEALDGVKSGEYYAALVVPEDFSENLIAFLNGTVEQPQIQYYVNEKKNAIAPKVTGTGASTIQDLINQTFVDTVGETVASILEDYSKSIVTDVDSSGGQVIDGLRNTEALLGEYKRAVAKAHTSISGGRNATSTVQKSLNDAQAANRKAAEALSGNDALIDQVKAEMDNLAGGELKTVALIYSDLKSINSTLSTASTLTDAEISKLKNVNSDLDASLKSIDVTLSATEKALSATQDQMSELIAEVSAIRSAEILQTLSRITGLDAQEIGSFLASPVTLETEVFFSVENYGSGMAPFYTILAIWVGGLVLIAILHLEVDKEGIESMTPNEAYFARGVLYVILGLMQSLIICLGDIYLLGIQCLHPLLFCIAGLVSGFVFVSLIYALATAFRHIGKALAVILIILQIPGSAGTYPVEMTSGFFRFIHPLLPFSYAIDAMRESIAGLYGHKYVKDLLILGIFLIVALIIGAGVRMLMLNINRVFDIELGKTGLMECEDAAQRYEYRKIKKLVGEVKLDEGMQKRILEKDIKFEENYERNSRRGIYALIVIPAILFLLMTVIPYKMPMLVLWIVSMITICVVLINHVSVHHLHEEKYGDDGGDDNA